MSAQTQAWLAVGLAAVLAGVGWVQLQPAGSLGLSEVVVRWLGLVPIILGPVLAAMHQVTRGRLQGEKT